MKKSHSKSRRGRAGNRNQRGGNMPYNYIYVTEHAIKRYQERIKKINREKAYQSIIESVKRSRLIALTKYGGREIRENRGALFVCELQGTSLNVITVLVSEVDLRFVS